MPARDLQAIPGLKMDRDVPLAPLTSFRIGGPAKLLLSPTTLSALEKVLGYLHGRGLAFNILGHGSNLLVNDAGVEIVLSLAGLDAHHEEAHGRTGRSTAGLCHVYAEAGCRLKTLLAWARRHEQSGLEGLAGIPASLGGAIAMNAGTAKGTVLDSVDSVFLVGPEGAEWIKASALKAGYRSVDLPSKTVVGAAGLVFRRRPRSEIETEILQTMRKRRLTQPIGLPSAGCVFRNPEGASAGRLIDLCGLKGRRQGDAEVSAIHANFIVNRGRARAQDVLALIHEVTETVHTRTSVRLTPEIAVWG